MNKAVYFIVLTSTILINTIDSTKKYGSFNLSVKKFEFCKGPKLKDCTIGSASRTSNTSIFVNVTVTENVAPTKAKVITYSTDSNETLRMHFNNPCTNLFLKSVFQSFFNVTSRCVILKGNYRINVDFEDILQRYYGGMFLYGTRIFKSSFYNNDCNFMCTYSELQISPV